MNSREIREKTSVSENRMGTAPVGKLMLSMGLPMIVSMMLQAVYKTLWKDGGCIAQCEFGPGAKPENVYQVFKAWENIRNR